MNWRSLNCAAAIVVAGGLSCSVMAQVPGDPAPVKVTADISALHWPGCPSYPCKAKRDGKMPGMRSDAIIVKFNADAKVRLRDAKESVGGLVDLGTGQIKDAAVQQMLAKYAALGCTWSKMHHTLSEERLDEMRTTAMHTLGKMITDMNGEFFLSIPAGLDTIAVIDDFNSLSIVEMAEQAPDAAPLPAAGDYRNNQGYLKIASEGINAYGVRLLAGGDGSAVKIADCEYSWNTAHLDLPSVTSLVANASDPFADNNHGTAVLGELGSRHDNIGTEGGAYGAQFYVAAANTNPGGYNLANAVTAAAAAVGAGGVVVIEQQTQGPNYTGVPAGTQFGLVASEWQQSVYNAIVTAIGNGVHVVAAAGNGSQNLDLGAYSIGHGGFYPFLAANDSGDIIVGAASPPAGSSTDRSRLGFSCYGATVDLQGYGENVYTTGYGDLYNATVNERYTAGFGGTSSATPIVSNAVALYSSIYKTRFGFSPSPSNTRANLRAQGSAQQNGANPATQNIGPRPDVLATWNSILTFPFLSVPANDTCAAAQDISSQGTFIGYNCGATNDGGSSCGGSNTNPDVWYVFTTPGTFGGTLVVTTCGTNDYGYTDQGMDSVVTLFTTCGGTEITCNDDSFGPYVCTFAGNNFDSAVSTTVTPGQQVFVRVAQFGTKPLSPFLLNVRLIPANDACASAQNVDAGGTFFGNLFGATNDGTATCGASAGNADVWYSYTACDGGTLHIDTCGTHDANGTDTGMDTVLSVLSSCGGTELACNDDAPSASLSCGASDAGALRDSKIDLVLTSGQNVLIRLSKFSSVTAGAFRLNVSYSAQHDTCNTAQLITPQVATAFNTTCMSSDGFTQAGCVTPVRDMWFYFFAPSTGPMRIQTCGSTFDTVLLIYDNVCPFGPNSPAMIACNDDACGFQSIVNFQALQGHDYGIRVGGFFSGSYGAGTIQILCPADFNRDGTISVQDIFDFLTAWFAGNPAADINGVNGLSVQDIFDFLGVWFAGC